MEKYQILEQVGEGTYGSVWRAKNLRTRNGNNDLVAIKIFHRVDDEGLSRSAVQELKFLQILRDCRGVVPLLDSCLHDGKLAVVFPFAESDLTGLCDCGPVLKLEEVKCIMRQMVAAIAKIHSFNLIHRDLKSANILFHQGRVYVADVGMMTQHENNKQHDPSLITRWYRAPELLLGKTNYGTEVDMWSVGCIFVEVMTKQTPFPGMNESHQMDRIFYMIGTPTVETWGEEVTTYSGWKKLRQGLYKTNQIRTVFKDWDSEALNLLERFWCPPATRITAEEALKHPFFSSDPLPCKPEDLPQVPSVHEYEVKKRRQQQQGGDHKRSRPPPSSQNGPVVQNSHINDNLNHVPNGRPTVTQNRGPPPNQRPQNGMSNSKVHHPVHGSVGVQPNRVHAPIVKRTFNGVGVIANAGPQ